MTMPAFAGGAVACALFLGSMWLLFDARVDERFGGSVGASLTYVPIVFMALLALLWGTRGATLAAFLGALIAIVNTAQVEGPFAGVEGFLGEAQLEVEGYALAIALTGSLIATLEASQRVAMRRRSRLADAVRGRHRRPPAARVRMGSGERSARGHRRFAAARRRAADAARHARGLAGARRP